MKKYICFESDDWGSYRLPLPPKRQSIYQLPIQLDEPGAEFFNEFDALESPDDVEALVNTLLKAGKNHSIDLQHQPVFTFLHATRNPNFEKIKATDFQEYFNESIEDSYLKTWGSSSLIVTKKAIEEKIIRAEFHCREHLNVPFWTKQLKNGDKETLLAAENEFWSFINKNPHQVFYQASFHLDDLNDIQEYQNIVSSGLEDFNQLFDYSSIYFVAPNAPYSNQLLPVLKDKGVKLICGGRLQIEPMGSGKNRKVYRIPGVKWIDGFYYVKRNAFFEPSDKSNDWVDQCLKQISMAFSKDQPAVISSHRVNYVSGGSVHNRDHGLKELEKLIHSIYKNWPEVEFVTSNQLLAYYQNEPKSLKYYWGCIS